MKIKQISSLFSRTSISTLKSFYTTSNHASELHQNEEIKEQKEHDGNVIIKRLLTSMIDPILHTKRISPPHSLSTAHKKTNRDISSSYFLNYSQLKPEPTLDDLHTSLSMNDPKQSWTIYKLLFLQDQGHLIHAETHTRLLKQTAVFPIVYDAASKAQKIHENMEEFSIKLDARDYLLLMRIHYRNSNDVGRITSLFNEAQSKRIKPTQNMYAIQLLSLAKAGYLDRVIEIYLKMCQGSRYAYLDTNTLSILIDAFGYAGQVDTVNELFANYLDDVEATTLTSKARVKNALCVYESVIRSNSVNGYKEEALELFNQIENHNLKLELSTFDALIEGLSLCASSQQDLDDAQESLYEFCRKECLSSPSTSSPLSTLASPSPLSSPSITNNITSTTTSTSKMRFDDIFRNRTLSQSDFEFSFLEKGESQNLSFIMVVPYMHTYESLIRGYGRLNDLDSMVRVFKQCQNDYSIVSQGVYESMIVGMNQCGEFELADTWNRGIRNKGYKIRIPLKV